MEQRNENEKDKWDLRLGYKKKFSLASKNTMQLEVEQWSHKIYINTAETNIFYTLTQAT
jgi:hypothetical protein